MFLFTFLLPSSKNINTLKVHLKANIPHFAFKMKCFSLIWLCALWWSALTRRLKVSLHETTHVFIILKSGYRSLSLERPSVDLQTGCFALLMSGGGLFCCALWKWFALHVCSISFLLFLPPVNKFVNGPGCRNRTRAQPPALLPCDIGLWFLFCFTGLDCTNLLRLTFVRPTHTHMGGRNITWKHTCELPKRFRDQFHLPACDKVQFSPGIFQVWLLFSHVTFHFAAFPRGSKHKIGDYMSDGGQPSDQSHVLGTLGWRFSRQALWESIQAVTQPDGWARYGTEGDIYSRVTSRNQRVSAPGGHPAWIYLKESCLFSIIFYHQCSCWSSNQIELVKTWFFFLL